MGCDIHFVIERRFGDRWVGVYSSVYTPQVPTAGESRGEEMDAWKRRAAFKQRNYDFFARLAGVRGAGPDPQGMPEDASDLAVAEFGDDCDLHSHSHLPYEEFVHRWVLSGELISRWIVDSMAGGVDKQRFKENVTGVIGLTDVADYRVVFCFDN